jgi:hypothetical protein
MYSLRKTKKTVIEMQVPVIDFISTKENYRTVFKKIYTQVQKLAAHITQLLENPAAVDAAHIKTTIFDPWYEFFSVNIANMSIIRHNKLPVELGTDELGYARQMKNTLGMHVFTELSRLYYLINWQELEIERENLATINHANLTVGNYDMLYSLKDTTHPLWVSIVNSFDIRDLYEEKEEHDEQVEELHANVLKMWEKPIFDYNAFDLQLVIMFITQQLNEITTQDHALKEYMRVFKILWMRIGYLLSNYMGPDVHNDEQMRVLTPFGENLYSCNRDMIAFFSFYMGEVARRCFYHETLIKNKHPQPPPLANLGEQTRNWVHRLLRSIADDSFEDIYQGVVPLAYEFVGDDGWFKYKRPNEVHSRGACITKLRPHLHRRFFSEKQLNKEVVVNAAATSYVSRLFVLKAIDEYIHMFIPNMHWMNGAVVENDMIEETAYLIQTKEAPLLIQVFSTFWVFNKGKFYVVDNIFEGVGLWFWILAKEYNSTLLGFGLGEFVRQMEIDLPAPAAAGGGGHARFEL